MNRSFLIECNLIPDNMYIDGPEALIPEIEETIDFVFKLFAQSHPLTKASPKCFIINNSIDKMNVLVHIGL